ncbi:MAG: hypothetical protein M3P95_11150, partial [Actinomycetota bacterium]|nr:hypothetical protein [Actinomycetota bacterium]
DQESVRALEVGAFRRRGHRPLDDVEEAGDAVRGQGPDRCPEDLLELEQGRGWPARWAACSW